MIIKNILVFPLKQVTKLESNEFELIEIIKTAQHFVEKNFIPVFFIEPKYEKEINIIKKNIINAYFPEHLASSELKNPS